MTLFSKTFILLLTQLGTALQINHYISIQRYVDKYFKNGNNYVPHYGSAENSWWEKAYVGMWYIAINEYDFFLGKTKENVNSHL